MRRFRTAAYSVDFSSRVCAGARIRKLKEHLQAALAAAYGETSWKCQSQFTKLRHVLRHEPRGVAKVIRALVHLLDRPSKPEDSRRTQILPPQPAANALCGMGTPTPADQLGRDRSGMQDSGDAKAQALGDAMATRRRTLRSSPFALGHRARGSIVDGNSWRKPTNKKSDCPARSSRCQGDVSRERVREYGSRIGEGTPLARLLADVETGTRSLGIRQPTPLDWSIQRYSLRSVPRQ